MDGGDEDEERKRERERKKRDDSYSTSLEHSRCKQVFCDQRGIISRAKSQVLVTGLKLFFVGTLGKVVIYDLLG